MTLVVHLNGLERGPTWLPDASLLERAVRESVRERPSPEAGPGVRPSPGAGSGEPPGPRPAGEISVTFVSDEEIARLNRRWLDREGPTDVIAFPLRESGGAPGGGEGGPAGGDDLLGDVYVAPGVAARNARRLGIDPAEEALRLVVHGVLHLIGHEHPEDESRYESEMFQVQERVLARLRRG